MKSSSNSQLKRIQEAANYAPLMSLAQAVPLLKVNHNKTIKEVAKEAITIITVVAAVVAAVAVEDTTEVAEEAITTITADTVVEAVVVANVVVTIRISQEIMIKVIK